MTALAAAQHDYTTDVSTADKLIHIGHDNGWKIEDYSQSDLDQRIWFRRARERVYIAVSEDRNSILAAHGWVVAGCRPPWAANGADKTGQVVERLQRPPLVVVS